MSVEAKKNIQVVLAFFFLGLWAICQQSLLIREALVVMFGNELIIGSFFATWFFWILVGAGLVSISVERIPARAVLFWLILFLAVAISPLQILLMRLGRSIWGVSPGVNMSFSASELFLLIGLAPSGLAIGAAFPVGARTFERYFGEKPKLIGTLYYIEAIGSLFGGMLFSFFFLPFLETFEITALLLFLFGIFFAWGTAAAKSGRHRVLWLVWVCVLLFSTVAENRLEYWSQNKRWKSAVGDFPAMVKFLDSPYHQITLAESGNQLQVYLNGQLANVIPDLYESELEAGLILMQKPDAKKIAVVSIGISDLVTAFSHLSEAKITYFVQDRVLWEQVVPWLKEQGLFSEKVGQQPRFYFGDGRIQLARTDATFDIILLDLPPPSSANINRFYTVEFFQLVRQKLNPHGVFVIRFPLSPNYLNEHYAHYLASLHRSVRSVFQQTVLTGTSPYFLFAAPTAGVLSDQPAVLVERWLAEGRDARLFNPYMAFTIFDSTQISFFTSRLQSIPQVPLNTDTHPLSYYFDLLIWNELSREHPVTISVFQFFWQTSWTLPLSSLGIVILLLAFCIGSGGKVYARRRLALLSTSLTGFSAMALQIILLLEFQNRFGALYQYIALVSAVFMIGLAGGSFVANQFLSRATHHPVLFLKIHGLLALVALGLPIVLPLPGYGIFHFSSLILTMLPFLMFVLLVGAITGAIFPVASSFLLKIGTGTGKAAGVVDAADHLGACIGALLTGVFLLPLLGRNGALYLVAGVNALLFCGWIIFRSRR